MQENNGGSGFLVFISGIVVGAAAALMLAPQPGAESRRQLADWVREKRRAARSGVEEARERIGA